MSIPTPSPAAVGKLEQLIVYVKSHYARSKAVVLKVWQKWKDEPIKTTGYGIIAAIVAYFAAEGIVDSNVTNLVTSLVTLGAGAPVVHAVNNQTSRNTESAKLQAKAEYAAALNELHAEK